MKFNELKLFIFHLKFLKVKGYFQIIFEYSIFQDYKQYYLCFKFHNLAFFCF